MNLAAGGTRLRVSGPADVAAGGTRLRVSGPGDVAAGGTRLRVSGPGDVAAGGVQGRSPAKQVHYTSLGPRGSPLVWRRRASLLLTAWPSAPLHEPPCHPSPPLEPLLWPVTERGARLSAHQSFGDAPRTTQAIQAPHRGSWGLQQPPYDTMGTS